MPPRKPAHRRITDPASPFTALQQRLHYMDRFPERTWVNVMENVPRWPTAPSSPVALTPDLLEYAPCEGQGFLLDALMQREERVHGVKVRRDQLLVTNGAMHGVSLVLRALAVPGATALVQAPVFTSIAQTLRLAGYRSRYFTVKHGTPDFERLEASLDASVKVIYVNSPNNPTGEVLSEAAMARLVALAKRRDLQLVADLVYDSFVFGSGQFGAPLRDPQTYEHVHVLNSMSKNYGSPGLRVGWVMSSAQNIQRLAAMLERECVAISGPSQRAAAALLGHGNKELVEYVRAGRGFLLRALETLPGVTFDEPAGGTQLFARLPVTDIEAFGDSALEALGLALATRSQYEGVDGPYIRLPLGADRSTLVRALDLLREALGVFGDPSGSAANAP